MEHGLSQKAVDIGSLFGLPIANSMVVTGSSRSVCWCSPAGPRTR